MADVPIYTKETLTARLEAIAETGWVPNIRHGNSGGIGNTLEELLGIKENNLPIPNAAEWELKAQRLGSSSLTTLFHFEPSPRAIRFVPQILLPKYGWRHQEAGERYGADEMSFRQTIGGGAHSDRGFKVVIDRNNEKVLVSFDVKSVDPRHAAWLAAVGERVGLGELDPQPYWGFADLEHKAGTKLLNAFYVQAEVKLESGQEYYWYRRATRLERFSFPAFLSALEQGRVLVDFDARSGHNHGTKFRLRQDCLPLLYETATVIVPAAEIRQAA